MECAKNKINIFWRTCMLRSLVTMQRIRAFRSQRLRQLFQCSCLLRRLG